MQRYKVTVGCKRTMSSCEKEVQHHVTGSNLFKQWSGCSEPILAGFRAVRTAGSLLHAGWAHNVFLRDGLLHLSGDYALAGRAARTLRPTLPAARLVLADDYRVLLADDRTLLRLDLETERFESIHSSSESVHPTTDASHGAGQAAARNARPYLAAGGCVYDAATGRAVDTSRCRGAVVSVVRGAEHAALLTDHGAVYTWGEGGRSQLGHGDCAGTHAPTPVAAIDHVRIEQIAAGGWHTAALSASGDVYVWGWNERGQLGTSHATPESSALPEWLRLWHADGSAASARAVSVACGSRHSALLLADGTVWTSGDNKYGQLGFSPDAHEALHRFKETSRFSDAQRVICGHWSTVVECRRA